MINVNARVCFGIAPIMAAMALSFLLAGCGASEGGSIPTTPSVPRPGALDAVLSTPNTNDGAVLFAISGGPVDSVTAGEPRIAGDARSAASIIVLGTVSSGTLLARVWVPDVGRASAYAATISQAAARGTYTLQSLSGYRITLLQR
jgi:hypothetical protein